MIKWIILDIDGVIIGSKRGVNSPTPHPDVALALRTVRSEWVFISLCTAKPHFAIRDTIELAGLENLHITDGGWVIIDPLGNYVHKTFEIETNLTKQVIGELVSAGIYTEWYTIEDYFIHSEQKSDITEDHYKVLQSYPQMVDSLGQSWITKIMPIARNNHEQEMIRQIFQLYSEDLVLSWWVHPVILPLQFGIITTKWISKWYAADEIAKREWVDRGELLAVGDSTSDWQFIQHCGYKVAMWNASNELQNLVAWAWWYIAPSVDENGVIEMLRHFKLLT